MPPSFRPVRNAAHEKNRETYFLTNPEHLGQTIHDPDLVRSSRFDPASRALATFHRTAAPAGGQKRHVRHSKYKSRRPYRIAPRFASSSQDQNRTSTVPCSARKESGRARKFPVRSCRVADSLFPEAAIGPVLRRTNEHFNEVIVQCIVKLALEAPFELGMIEVARMKIEIISVHRYGPVFELNDHFNPFSLGSGREVEQGMLIET